MYHTFFIYGCSSNYRSQNRTREKSISGAIGEFSFFKITLTFYENLGTQNVEGSIWILDLEVGLRREIRAILANLSVFSVSLLRRLKVLLVKCLSINVPPNIVSTTFKKTYSHKWFSLALWTRSHTALNTCSLNFNFKHSDPVCMFALDLEQ